MAILAKVGNIAREAGLKQAGSLNLSDGMMPQTQRPMSVERIVRLTEKEVLRMFRLPDYEVIVHILYNDFGKKLENDLASETSSYEIYESIEYQGVKDYHWAFATWEEAIEAGRGLKKYVKNPNLLVLRITANCDDKIEPITYKDSRPLKNGP